jgi:hypothetical protein
MVIMTLLQMGDKARILKRAILNSASYFFNMAAGRLMNSRVAGPQCLGFPREWEKKV